MPTPIDSTTGFSSSNATSSHFLGTQQRPWMSAGYRRNVIPPSSSNNSTLQPSTHEKNTRPSNNSTDLPSQPKQMTVTPTPQQIPLRSQSLGGQSAGRKRSLDSVTSVVEQRPLRHPSSNDGGVPQAMGSAVIPPPAGLVNHRPQANLLPSKRSHASAYIPRLDVFNDQLRLPLHLEGPLESQRISLLREACLKDDTFYLILHQIFCGGPLDPGWVAHLGFSSDQIRGLDILKIVLLPNNALPPIVLRFFADFPASRLQNTSDIVLAQIKEFLPRFLHGWYALRDACFVRQYPPFAAELMSRFTANSSVLQKILFNSIHRQLRGDGDDDSPYSQDAFKLFDDDQRRFMQSGSHVMSDAEIDAMNVLLGGRYLRLRFLTQSAPSCGQNLAGVSASAQTTMQAPSPVSNAPVFISGAARQPCSIATAGVSTRTLASQQFLPSQRELSANQNQLSLVPQPTAPLMHVYHDQTRSDSVSGPFASVQNLTRRPGLAPTSNMPFNGRDGILMQSSPAPSIHSNAKSPYHPIQHNSFIPALGEQPVRTSNPNPNHVALHQLHLRSPTVRKVDGSGSLQPDLRLYQYLKSFVIAPQVLHGRGFQFFWHFTTSSESKNGLAKDVLSHESQDSRPTRLLMDGSCLYRLRCIMVPEGAATLFSETASWVLIETTWPECCFVSVNEEHLELRRKTHHGKDLALDLTSYVREGINTIKFSILRTPHELTKKCFAIAVEAIKVAEGGTVKSMARTITSEESISAMIRGMKVHASDDDLQVVDSHISIDVVDPFMATIFNEPVRGMYCTHRECFDLDTFLQTRKTGVKNGPTSPDEWKCPICGRDARPQSLVVDGFLKQVRAELERTSRLDTKAILVKTDGSWVPKENGQGTVRVASRPRNTPMDDEHLITRSGSVVIELDY